jgi:hypothetical protein
MTALPGRKGKETASRRARREGTLLWDFTASALMIIADDCAGAVYAGLVPALDFRCHTTLTTLPQFCALGNPLPSGDELPFRKLLFLQASALPIAHLFHEGFAPRPFMAMAMTKLTCFGWTHRAARM